MAVLGLVYLVDDDLSLCELIQTILRREGLEVRTFPTAEAFANAVIPPDPGNPPCCLMVDVEKPGPAGWEHLDRRFSTGLPWPVILITTLKTARAVVKSMRLWTVNILEKPFTPETLTTLVFDTLQKHKSIRAQTAAHAEVRDRITLLSPRERELLHEVVQGHSTREIAESMGISSRTVDHHRANMMNKMRARNVADVVRMAMEADYTAVLPNGGTVEKPLEPPASES